MPMQVSNHYPWKKLIEILRNAAFQDLIFRSYRTADLLRIIVQALLTASGLRANIVNTSGKQLALP